MTLEEFGILWQKSNHGKVADSEHDLQVTCVKWFRYNYRAYMQLLFAIPNGGWRNTTTAAKLKAEGVIAGVPDLFLAVPNGKYHGLFIEMKNGKAGRLSSVQKDMLTLLRNENYQCEVCHTFPEFVTAVQTYLRAQTAIDDLWDARIYKTDKCTTD